jgi:DME family drug/metabolite transporter
LSGAWLILAAAVCWGTTGTAQAFAPPEAQSAVIGAARLALGSLTLLVFTHWRGSLPHGRRFPFWNTLLAGACMAAYQLFFFAGVRLTGVAVGTVVAIGSAPILAGLLARLLRGEPLERRWALATVLAVSGCALLMASGRAIQVNAVGLLLALGAGASYAIFAVTSKTVLERTSPEAAMAVIFSLGALLLAPAYFTNDLAWLGQPRGFLVILHLGLVTVALAYSLFAYGLKQVPVASAATLTLAEPLTAGILGVFLLGERLPLPAWMGVGLIFAGLGILSSKRRS